MIEYFCCNCGKQIEFSEYVRNHGCCDYCIKHWYEEERI